MGHNRSGVRAKKKKQRRIREYERLLAKHTAAAAAAKPEAPAGEKSPAQ